MDIPRPKASMGGGQSLTLSGAAMGQVARFGFLFPFFFLFDILHFIFTINVGCL